jgi:hypothetical protein
MPRLLVVALPASASASQNQPPHTHGAGIFYEAKAKKQFCDHAACIVASGRRSVKDTKRVLAVRIRMSSCRPLNATPSQRISASIRGGYGYREACRKQWQS